MKSASYCFSGRFFDGSVIHPVRAKIEVTSSGLMITYRKNDTLYEIAWPKHELQLMERFYDRKPAVVGSKGMLGARMIIHTFEDYEAVLKIIPRKNIKFSHVQYSWRLFWILPAILFILFIFPIWKIHSIAIYIAALLPDEAEQLLWEETFVPAMSNFSVCTAPQGVRSLQALVSKLTQAGHITHPIDVKIIYSPDEMNAFSVPDYHILIYSSMMNINDPDAFAAILAHEMGHSVYHHGLAQLISQVGLSTIFKALFGISPNNVASDFLNLKYTRDYERQADQYAINLLQKANINPLGFRKTMEYLQKNAGDFSTVEGYFVDHPTYDERIRLVPFPITSSYTPSLTPTQWQSLRAICDETTPFDDES